MTSSLMRSWSIGRGFLGMSCVVEGVSVRVAERERRQGKRGRGGGGERKIERERDVRMRGRTLILQSRWWGGLSGCGEDGGVVIG